MCRAFRIVGTISLTVFTVALNLQIEWNKLIWSMSCRAPLPFRIPAAAPPDNKQFKAWFCIHKKKLDYIPINKIGDSANWAFFTAVTVFVTPGPAVTAATPTVLERRATASAANTAETYENFRNYTLIYSWQKVYLIELHTSWRVSITRIPCFSAATKIGEMWPPARVKMNLTPCALRTSATNSPPCLLDAVST